MPFPFIFIPEYDHSIALSGACHFFCKEKLYEPHFPRKTHEICLTKNLPFHRKDVFSGSLAGMTCNQEKQKNSQTPSIL